MNEKPKCKSCKTELVYKDDEYGSLASGGSYEIWVCPSCGKTHYFELLD